MKSPFIIQHTFFNGPSPIAQISAVESARNHYDDDDPYDRNLDVNRKKHTHHSYDNASNAPVLHVNKERIFVSRG